MRSAPQRSAHTRGLPTHGAQSTPGQDFEPLHRCVERALTRYLADLDGAPCTGLYALVMDEVERPMLECVMASVDHNQTRAALVLGLNRGTLRKKLKSFGLLED